MSEKDFIVPIDPQNHALLDVIRATVQVARKQAWEDGANWMLQRFRDLPSVIRADQTDIEFVSYMGKSLSYHAEQYALPNHDPRKGAE